MNIDIFTLCDRAQCYENKLMVIGAFDVLSAQNIMAAAHPICIAARLAFTTEECGANTVRIEGVEVESGLKVLDLSNSVEIAANGPFQVGLLNVALNDVPVLFPREGKYQFTLSVEGKATGCAKFDLYVIKRI